MSCGLFTFIWGKMTTELTGNNCIKLTSYLCHKCSCCQDTLLHNNDVMPVVATASAPHRIYLRQGSTKSKDWTPSSPDVFDLFIWCCVCLSSIVEAEPSHTKPCWLPKQPFHCQLNWSCVFAEQILANWKVAIVIICFESKSMVWTFLNLLKCFLRGPWQWCLWQTCK